MTAEDTTRTALVGLPVAVTHNATTGRWVVEVDMTDLADELADAGGTEMLTAWLAATEAWSPRVEAVVRFVPRGEE